MNSFNLKKIRSLFPYFVSGKNKNSLYFDNAATTHKPRSVINEISGFYENDNSNVHRGIYDSSSCATEKYEGVRQLARDFVGASQNDEIVFTSGTTESVNFVAHSYVKECLSRDDVILVSPMEHHANLIPWQIIAKEKGLVIKELPMNKKLKIDFKKLGSILNNRVKLVAVNHVSNVTGIIQDVHRLVKVVKKFNTSVFVDGAQAVPHIGVNVCDLGCDFYAFSGHKLFGPTGTGVLFIKNSLLSVLPPYKTGGQMVSRVSFKSSEWAPPPLKFEAGTPNIAGVIGLGEAIRFMREINHVDLSNYEKQLSQLLTTELQKIPEIDLYGNSDPRDIPIVAFNIRGVHHYDLASLLSENKVFVRSGHLCNQGLMDYLGINGCVRVSLSIYNGPKEIHQFIAILKKIIKFLKGSC